MRQVVVGVVAGVLLVGAGVATATAQPTKSVSGTVTAVGPDSVTVKVKDQDMKFNIDNTTDVIARGATTATRAAQKEGKSGPAIGTLVKPGQSIEVKYHEPAMHAANIRVLQSATATPAPAATTGQKEKAKEEKPKTSSASGTVTAMTGSSLTVKTSAGESTFSVDSKTKIVGTGLGTKAKEAAAAGKKQVLADTVAVGDTVAVSYREEGGAKQATEVRVRQKAKK
jgi:hypothetical protein